MVVIKGVVGSHGSSLASLIPLALQRSYGYKVTMNDWVRALGLALDESRWFAIYRLLNIFRMAGRRDTLSLPTSVHVERDGFSPPSPSTRLGGLPQIFGFCNVDMSLHTDRDNIRCSGVGSLCRVLAYVLFGLLLAKFGPGGSQGPPCPGSWWPCASMCCRGACAAPRGAAILVTEYPKTAGFGPKPCVLATRELRVELRSLVCRLMEVLWLLPSPSSLSVALTGGSCIFSEGFACWLRVCEAFGDRAVTGSCVGTPLGLSCSHNAIRLSWRSVSLVQKTSSVDSGGKGGD